MGRCSRRVRKVIDEENKYFCNHGVQTVLYMIGEENDFYATEPKATELLLEKETFNKNILEPCAGMGHIRDVLVSHGYNVTATDLIYRGVDDINQEDVFNIKEFTGDIITNPPYKIALPILKHCLDIIPDGNKVAMFLKVLFLEGKERKKFFEENPPRYISPVGD